MTEAELWNQLPFDAPLTRQRIQGSALRTWLAAGDDLVRSGARVLRETGDIEIHGRPLRDHETYWVTAPGLTLPAAGPSDAPQIWTVHEALDRCGGPVQRSATPLNRDAGLKTRPPCAT